MTPEEARALLDGTTPGPWEWRWDAGLLSLFGAKGESVATDLDVRDSDLAAAAPALARMVAAMQPKYRAEYQTVGGLWFPTPNSLGCSDAWGTKQKAERRAAEWKADGYPTRIVRRYVTEQEEIS